MDEAGLKRDGDLGRGPAPATRHGLGKTTCAIALSLGLTSLGLGACDSDEPQGAEALATDADKKFEETEYKKKKIERPTEGLPRPSEAEFAAWDRKDPEGEKHLYKWDKRNLDKMKNYWDELRCFREAIMVEGEKAAGAEPLSAEAEKWHQFKQGFIPFINGWQQRLFANEPRILEKSKFIGHILEAHELVMHGYPKAYNDGDEIELKKAEAHWVIVEDKVKGYAEQLGGEWTYLDTSDPKEAEKWEKFCAKAKTEPKDGPKKRKRGI